MGVIDITPSKILLEYVRKQLNEELQLTIPAWKRNVDALPILHNGDMIALVFCGWQVVLKDDGTWYAEDTTGG